MLNNIQSHYVCSFKVIYIHKLFLYFSGDTRVVDGRTCWPTKCAVVRILLIQFRMKLILCLISVPTRILTFFKIVTLDFLYLHNTHWGVIFIPIRYKLDSFLETAHIFLNLKKIRILNILHYIVSIDRLDPIDTRFCVDAVYERTHGIS